MTDEIKEDTDEYYVYCYECDEVKLSKEVIWDGIHHRCREHPYGMHREISVKHLIKKMVEIIDKEQKIEALTNGL